MVRGFILKLNNHALAFILKTPSISLVSSYAYTSLSRLGYIISAFTASFWVSHKLYCSRNNTMFHVVTRKIVRWICNSVWGSVWAPRAVCLQIHLSAPNQILLDRCLSPHCPDILHSVWLQGVQDKVKGLRFSHQGPHPYPIHCPLHPTNT